jgi:hypothetical protein
VYPEGLRIKPIGLIRTNIADALDGFFNRGEKLMKKLAKRLTVVFSAGCLGGLANSIAVWLFGVYGITKTLGVNLSPSLSAGWLYPRIVWGGIWGLLFLLPLFRNSITKRGLLLSLGPTIVQLFIVFPYKTHQGMMGMGLGALTPIFVFVFNGIWGMTVAIWIRYIRE